MPSRHREGGSGKADSATSSIPLDGSLLANILESTEPVLSTEDVESVFHDEIQSEKIGTGGGDFLGSCIRVLSVSTFRLHLLGTGDSDGGFSHMIPLSTHLLQGLTLSQERWPSLQDKQAACTLFCVMVAVIANILQGSLLRNEGKRRNLRVRKFTTCQAKISESHVKDRALDVHNRALRLSVNLQAQFSPQVTSPATMKVKDIPRGTWALFGLGLSVSLEPRGCLCLAEVGQLFGSEKVAETGFIRLGLSQRPCDFLQSLCAHTDRCLAKFQKQTFRWRWGS